jgi:hypothetical protein
MINTQRTNSDNKEFLELVKALDIVRTKNDKGTEVKFLR